MPLMANDQVLYGQDTLPQGIRSRGIDTHTGLVMHLLEAGFEAATGAAPERPCIVLLHGFPELAYSWRKVLLPLAAAGYHVVAPDQRGYGRSDGTDVTFDDPLWPFTLLQHVRDTLGLVFALGHRTVAAVVGHDYGSPVAAWCALSRPDVFRSLVMMSAPFEGPPGLPFNSANVPNPSSASAAEPSLQAELAALDPPRKHYHWYNSTRAANTDWSHSPQGTHAFLRAYYHMKSADWPANQPTSLASWTASELARLPRYYVMDLDRTMPESVAPAMPSADQIAACTWLTEAELGVYSSEFERTGFQGGLQSYRVGTDPRYGAELRLFAGRTIDVPACFIGGASDWGVYQRPGRLERLHGTVCTDLRHVHLVSGAGHWVQQEQASAVCEALVEFLRDVQSSTPVPR
jgi:pimeloyl-ACP methyl ester carboxylesterase